MSEIGSSGLGNAIQILKLQKIDLTVGILVSLIAVYVFLAVIIYKPERRPSPRNQPLQDPLGYGSRTQSTSIEDSVNVDN